MTAKEAPMKISKEAQKHVIAYADKLLQRHKQFAELQNKMEIIDQAYARYKATGEDTVTCGDLFSQDDVTPPLVVSQVDSMVAYWSDVFLSGYPIFPVVSTPAKRMWAEKLEALVDDHSILGAYPAELMQLFFDAAKYNFSALECDWDMVQQYNVIGDYLAEDSKKLDISPKHFTKLRRLDPYNVIWDYNESPAAVSKEGDYAGYIDLKSRIKLKRLLNRYTATREVYNASEAMAMGGDPGAYTFNYRMPPQISEYANARRPIDTTDWAAYMGGQLSNRYKPGAAENFEIFTFYARILPVEFGITAPQPNTPQIWKFVIVNGKVMIHAKRVISPYDHLPILFGQPRNDGLSYQTQSIAEGVIPFQEAANTLYNIRFAAARRAVSDRAIYDQDAIKPSHINSKAPAPKIPVNLSALGGKTLEGVYKAIPFDLRGTETALQDATVISEFSKELSGLNNAQRGQFQRGNKSVTEWNDVMGNSDNRLRLSGLALEFQLFVPLKQMIVLNIFQYGDDAIVVSQKTGEVLDVNIQELRKHVMSFRLADGYTPKSKMASSEMLQAGMQLLMSSEVLQQAFGPSLPAMFAHLMQLGGVRGLEEYTPERQAQAQEEDSQDPGLQGIQQATGAPQEPGIDPGITGSVV